MEALNKSLQDFSRPLVPDAVYRLHPCRHASMQAPALLSFRRMPESSRGAGVLQSIPILSDCVMPAETRHGLSFPHKRECVL